MKNNRAAGGDIPLKLLKECDFTDEKLTNCIYNSNAKQQGLNFIHYAESEYF